MYLGRIFSLRQFIRPECTVEFDSDDDIFDVSSAYFVVLKQMDGANYYGKTRISGDVVFMPLFLH